jgi:hypothetical protein
MQHIALPGPAQKRRRALDDRGFHEARPSWQRLRNLAHRSTATGACGWRLQRWQMQLHPWTGWLRGALFAVARGWCSL